MFKTKSVDALIAGSSKLIAKLEAAADAHKTDHAVHKAAAAASIAKASASQLEADRAITIATKLKGIFS